MAKVGRWDGWDGGGGRGVGKDANHRRSNMYEDWFQGRGWS